MNNKFNLVSIFVLVGILSACASAPRAYNANETSQRKPADLADGDVSGVATTAADIEKTLQNVPGIVAKVSAVQLAQGLELKVTEVAYSGTLYHAEDHSNECNYSYTAKYILAGGKSGQVQGGSRGGSTCFGENRSAK